jgi:hypothetical protein
VADRRSNQSCPLEEAAQLQVPHQQHEPEQEHQHIEVDGPVGILQRESAHGDHGNSAQQGRGGAVEVQPANPLDRDEKVCEPENQKGCVHKQRER